MRRLSLILAIIAAHAAFGVSSVHAADYIPLIEIPGIGSSFDAETYIRTLFILAIGIAAFIAVGRLVLAGFKYVTSSIVTEKSDAKKDITSAILGLVIILAATTILTTINPSISNLPALTNIVVPPVPDRERVEVNDARDSANQRAVCEARAAQTGENWVYKLKRSDDWQGTISGSECCIPGSTGESACSRDSTTTIGDNIIIDTEQPYTRAAYSELLAAIRATGRTVTDVDVLLVDEERPRQTCEVDGGTPYIVLRDRAINYVNPERKLLCVYDD